MLRSFLVFLTATVWVSSAFAGSLGISPPSQSVAKGSAIQLKVSYQGGTAAEGLGLRIHYNSHALKFDQVVSVLRRDLIGVQAPVDDKDNLDGDDSTDKYILVAWADVNNDGWLDSDSESLIVLSFITGDASSQTHVRLSTSDKAPGLSTQGAVATVQF